VQRMTTRCIGLVRAVVKSFAAGLHFFFFILQHSCCVGLNIPSHNSHCFQKKTIIVAEPKIIVAERKRARTTNSLQNPSQLPTFTCTVARLPPQVTAVDLVALPERIVALDEKHPLEAEADPLHPNVVRKNKVSSSNLLRIIGKHVKLRANCFSIFVPFC